MLDELGPTFVKFGQLLSTRPDIVPPDIIAELRGLQDDVRPFPFADVERVVREDLGQPIERMFLEFEERPLAAASIGQVHRAVLPNGRRVAVKVQRPNAPRQIDSDIRLMEQAARLAHEQENREYLPEVRLPSQLRIEPASSGLERSEYVFLAVPSYGLGELIRTLVAAGLSERAALVSVAKGLIPPEGAPPTAVLAEAFGSHRVACLGGPAHAQEMVHEGAALVAASRDEQLARTLAQIFTRAGVVCEQSNDPLGVELAGAAKNAAALAAGATEAQGLNAAGAAAGHIFAEVWRYAHGLGARPESMIGLAGAGDLVATALARDSRNRRAGELLAAGVPAAEIPPRIGQAFED